MSTKKLILAGALDFAALSGTNLSGLEATKAIADSIETNLSTLEERAVEVDHGVIVVKSKQYEETVSVYIENLSNVKVGDEVKATGSMMRNFTEYMVATDVENTKNKLGMMEDSATKYVVVEYPSKNGEKDVIDVFLTKGQVFKKGEKVKIDMKYVGWSGISINYNTVGHIKKVNETKNNTQNNDDVWIWS
ncbi:ATP F0F1 synthase subunit alpha [Bacillus thuringiensis serovar andalousiensis]|nr:MULTISPECIES: ATP F0F1 synthase subunit alpha [Bacillus cereus group]MDA2615369.1 hypothetical protein [Bacillus cereus]MEB8555938.1 hypothetical protein [Bacillus cereus]MEB8725548.1 hypothetical protein [Bacillus cereus]MEB8823213.1 hypothetical protein [Bacillus cereus]MEB8972777.1 hypothetical protein [Bacillus cereus]